MQDSVVDDEVVMYNDIQSGEHRFLVAYCVCDASFYRDILSEALSISSIIRSFPSFTFPLYLQHVQ